MIQRRKTMLLAGCLHAGELAIIEFVLIDVSPIVDGCVHGETGSDGPVGSNDDIVLTSNLPGNRNLLPTSLSRRLRDATMGTPGRISQK